MYVTRERSRAWHNSRRSGGRGKEEEEQAESWAKEKKEGSAGKKQLKRLRCKTADLKGRDAVACRRGSEAAESQRRRTLPEGRAAPVVQLNPGIFAPASASRRTRRAAPCIRSCRCEPASWHPRTASCNMTSWYRTTERKSDVCYTTSSIASCNMTSCIARGAQERRILHDLQSCILKYDTL